MTDASDLKAILTEHTGVGRAKPVSYLPIATISSVLGMSEQGYVQLIHQAGAASAIFREPESCIKSGAVYAFSRADLQAVLIDHRALLHRLDWPDTPSDFIATIATQWFAEDHPAMNVIRAAFGDHPLSIKGVLMHGGRVLLLLNERGEWDLPGGRPDPGEDHRATLKREVFEEAGLTVEIGARLDEHLFEVLPRRFVRIVAYACNLVCDRDVVLSPEHLDTRWVPLADLGETIDGHPLPKGYLGAIRQAIDQPRSPSERVV